MSSRCASSLLLSFAVAIAALASCAETLSLRYGASACMVDLDGARVVSLVMDGREILWNDSPRQKSAPDWAHGGIPLCWPNFGVDSAGRIHGTAWRRPFKVVSKSEGPSRAELTASLEDADLRLEYKIILADSLILEMTTENLGTNSIGCSFGFHPYFAVGERDCCRVDGIDGFNFEDDPSVANRAKGTWVGQLAVTNTIDRIFEIPNSRPGVFTLYDDAKGRALTVSCVGASHMNIWNPGVEKACPGVVPADQWRRFVCVEPIVLGQTPQATIPAKGKRNLKMEIAIRRKNGVGEF